MVTLVYIVAGLSSRFGGIAKSSVKVGPNGETLIEYSVNQALKSNFSKIIFVVSKKTEGFFKEIFRNNYKKIPIEYAYQTFDSEKRDKPWGTCDAICSAIELIKEPFVVATGDDIYGEKTFEILFNHLEKNFGENATATKNLIEMLPKEGNVNRGIFELNEQNYVTGAKEEVAINRKNFEERGYTKDTQVSISIFALLPKTLKLLNSKLIEFKEKYKGDRKIECYLNEKLGKLIRERKIKMKLYKTPEKWTGITNPGDEEKIKKELSNK